MINDKKKILIERIKNILIVVLFLTTVLLLSFFWKDISLRDLSPINIAEKDADLYVPETHDLIQPKNILFSFGSDTYTVKTGEESYGEGTVTDKIMELTDKYLSSASYAEQIQADQYEEVMSYASVIMRFDYSIPAEEFFEENDISCTANLNDLGSMTSIGFSPVSSENLLIRDRNTDIYYRITVSDESVAAELGEEVSAFITSMEESDYIPYYYIADIVGVENDALMPLFMSSDLTEMEGTKEFSISDQAQANKIAAGFFASGLDFVRKITENKGSLLYMYGSSQSLIMEGNGTMRYSETFDPSIYRQLGFYDSLENAVEYVSTHGKWESLYRNGCQPYLKMAYPITNSQNSGYHFVFGMKKDGVTIEYSEGDIISADVFGDQITSYQRDVVVLSEERQEEKEVWDSVEPVNILTANYAKIGEVIGTSTFEEMAVRVESIKFCFIRDKQNDSLAIKPVWLITVSGGSCFWFDPGTGELLGYISAEVK